MLQAPKALAIKSISHDSFTIQLWCTLTFDFPFFEDHCELSHWTLCDHPYSSCRHWKTSLVGYMWYNPHLELQHKFVPLPFDPQPIFQYICNGCKEEKDDCTKQCSSYTLELVKYKVCKWNIYTQWFSEEIIKESDYKPELHRYFSYRVYQETHQEEIARRRERQVKKQKRDLLDELLEGESDPKKKRQTTPIWCADPTSLQRTKSVYPLTPQEVFQF